VASSRDDVRSTSIVVANQRVVVTQASGVPPPPPPPPTPPPRGRLPHRHVGIRCRASPTSWGPATAAEGSA
jgi:hypothetical protein